MMTRKTGVSSILLLVMVSGMETLTARSSVDTHQPKDAMTQYVQGYSEKSLTSRWKGAARNVAGAVMEESRRHGLDPLLVLAVIQHESRFNPDAIGLHGEIGLMQIKPDTAEWVARKNQIEWYGPSTLRNPVMNIRIGTAYLKMLRSEFRSNKELYLAAYNMGSRNVRRVLSSNARPTIYAQKVISNYRQISRTQRSPSSL